MPIALCFGTFAWSFVYVSLPFYIERLNPGDPVSTLRWTGWILGVTPLLTVAIAPVWGRLAGDRNPKWFYVAVQSLQGLAFLGMALARSLSELFLARLVLGLFGASSTFAFIIAGRAASPDAVRREVAAVQGMMTVGQIMGPLAGAIAAEQLGFRGSFVLGALILWGCAGLVGSAAAAPPAPAETPRKGRALAWRQVAAACVLVLGGSVEVMFLPSILPAVLPALGVRPADTLLVGGAVVFASGIAAALGSLLVPRLSRIASDRTLIVWLLVVSSLLLASLAPLTSVWAFGLVRCLQMLCVAPLFPIVVTRIAQLGRGEVIGMVNAARIGAAFVGPVVATTVLASTSTTVVYLLLAALGLACVPFALDRPSGGREARA